MTTTTTKTSLTSTTYFVNPPPLLTNTSISSSKKIDKSQSMVDRPNNVKREMSYRTNDLPQISRHLSETPATEGKQNYEDLVSCMVCYDSFDNVNEQKLPKILPCQHTYCVQCIKNLMHCSSDRNKFACPQCKFGVEGVKDVRDLPTNRIVLSLLEKESLNFQGYASCPSCLQIRNLEVCFECNLPLCVQCISKHFDRWRNDMSGKFLQAEQGLEVYKQNIDQISPQITNNFENIQAVKDSIEEAYNSLLTRLRNEKERLLETVNEVKEENAKYINLRKDIAGLITNFKMFRESNETFDKKSMMTRIKTSQMYMEKIPKLEREYNNVISSNFRTLERFEKRPLPDSDYNMTGNLVINQVNLSQAAAALRHQSSRSSLTSTSSSGSKDSANREQQKNVKSNAPLPPTNIQVASNGDALSRWITTSQAKPQSELTLASVPLHLASYGNLLFSMDQTSYLSVYEKVFSVELKLKNTVKLNMPGVKGISVNARYLAVAYSGLKKEQLKGALKNMSSTGIILYGRDQHVVCSIYEKLLDITKSSSDSSSFRNLSSVALTDTTCLAADKDARCIYEIDLASSTLMRTLTLDGQPVSVSVNRQLVACADALNSLVYLFDRASLATVGRSQAPIKSGVEQVLLSDDNLVFVRGGANESGGQVSLLDGSLEAKATFGEIQARVTNLALIRDQNCLLAIGGMNSKQQFKIYGYMV